MSRKRTPLPPKPEPQPLADWPNVLVELREVGAEDCNGGGEKYRLRWRRVVVADGLTDELRHEMRRLRALGLYAGPLLGDELEPTPDSTWRGIPPGASDPRLCGARTQGGWPCRSLALPNGRCKWHGGRSTGPRSPEGTRRSAANLVLARAALASKRRAG